MRKILSVILALTLALALTPLSSLAESTPENIDFEATIFSFFDFSADEWVESEVNRALGCLLIMLDISMDTCPQPINIDQLNTSLGSYIAKADTTLYFLYCMTDGSVVLVQVAPDGSNPSQFCILNTDAATAEAFETIAKAGFEGNCSEYYAVSEDDMMLIASILDSMEE